MMKEALAKRLEEIEMNNLTSVRNEVNQLLQELKQYPVDLVSEHQEDRLNEITRNLESLRDQLSEMDTELFTTVHQLKSEDNGRSLSEMKFTQEWISTENGSSTSEFQEEKNLVLTD